MIDCATILRSAAVDYQAAPTAIGDLVSACIQFQAGEAQAYAARFAGRLTLIAGLLAVAAAIIGSTLAWRATQAQIREQKIQGRRQRTHEIELLARQRRHELKSDIYVKAVQGLAVAVGTSVRISDLSIDGKDVLSEFEKYLPNIFAAHLVADLATAETLLACIQKFGDMHRSLIKRRPIAGNHHYDRDTLIGWARTCTGELAKVVPSMVAAVASMRTELDLPVDMDAYTALIDAAMKNTSSANDKLFSEMFEGWSPSKNSPDDTGRPNPG